MTGAPATALVTAAGITVGWNGLLSVGRGGIGVGTVTPWAVICGGTTPTGALQDVGSLGTAGQVLTSAGAGALPVWSNGGSGSGTVNSSSYQRLAYYSTNPTGTVVDGLANVADRVLVTVGTVPTWSLTLPTGTTIGGYVKADGSVPMTGELLLVNSTPSTGLAAASKGYVDTIASGLSVQPAAQAATIANLNATQAGAGIGATLTNAGAQAAFAVDGYSAALNDAILVKDQTLSQHNGIYIVTTLGSGASNWVLTRATYYDTAAQIKPGNLVAVNTGTVNGGTAWLQTQTVVTVDTDPITFSPFAVITAGIGLTKVGNQISLTSPVALNLGGTNNNALTAVNGGIVYSDATKLALSAAGATNQLLVSGGAGAPTWLANAASSVLVTDGGSVPSFSTTLPAGLTIPGYAHSGANGDITSMTGLTGYLQAPLGIKDVNGNTVLEFSHVASAINYLGVVNRGTGAFPYLYSAGVDTIGFGLVPRGGKVYILDSLSTTGAAISFANAANTHSTVLKVASAQSTNLELTLPALDGTASAPLQTDGAGTLSFGGTFTDISGTVTVNGFSSFSTKLIRQCNVGKIVHISMVISGISNSVSFTVTGLPNASNIAWLSPALITNSGVNNIGLVGMGASATTLTVYASAASTAFGNTNGKAVYVNFFYERT